MDNYDKKYVVEADDPYITGEFMIGTNWLIIALICFFVGLLFFREVEFSADRPKNGF